MIDTTKVSRELDAAVHMKLHPLHRVWPSNNAARWRYCDADHEKQHACNWRPLPYYSWEKGLKWCEDALNDTAL
jgi:hypothetical protein